VVAVHAREEQLLVAHPVQEGLGERGLPSRLGVLDGLQPA